MKVVNLLFIKMLFWFAMLVFGQKFSLYREGSIAFLNLTLARALKRDKQI